MGSRATGSQVKYQLWKRNDPGNWVHVDKLGIIKGGSPNFPHIWQVAPYLCDRRLGNFMTSENECRVSSFSHWGVNGGPDYIDKISDDGNIGTHVKTANETAHRTSVDIVPMLFLPPYKYITRQVSGPIWR